MVEEEYWGRESTKMKWTHIRGGVKREGWGKLVLVLGLFENDDGHRGYAYDVKDAGEGTFNGGYGRGVFNTTLIETWRDTNHCLLYKRHTS